MTIPVLPETPTDLASARTYLAWIADASLRVQIPRDAALAATKAVEAWVRVENYDVAAPQPREEDQGDAGPCRRLTDSSPRSGPTSVTS